VNEELSDLFHVGQGQLLVGKCEDARQIKARITDLMYIPLIQGTLRYAYKVGNLMGGEKEKAQGATFAAAVLPKVHSFDSIAAATIYSNMGVEAEKTSYSAVKKAFEGVYKDIGISCSDIGGLVDPEGNYYDGAEPCSDDIVPPLAPSSSPTAYCVDDASFRFKTKAGKSKSCKWLHKMESRQNKYCSIKDEETKTRIKFMCRDACRNYLKQCSNSPPKCPSQCVPKW